MMRLSEIGFPADYLLICILHLYNKNGVFFISPSGDGRISRLISFPISIFYYSHSILADDVDNAGALVLVPLMHIKCNFLRGPFYGVIRLAAFNGKYKHGKLAKNACDRNFKSLNAK